ncbi:hypothetical protein [Clostridium tagluense]|uniref:hypothetical protein n=1 Tax=Clostridium tagluense TaxID=360422 RepID=UPI001CF37AB1|nr:hypothetical protein [Clostridium tagluense]MCB2296702.1 hypothetical protein [Clostridium tagluense]
MSKKRCCGVQTVNACCGVQPVNSCGVQSLCSNPICALIILIILQRTCLLENKNAFILILLFLGFCFCRRPVAAVNACSKSCGC